MFCSCRHPLCHICNPCGSPEHDPNQFRADSGLYPSNRNYGQFSTGGSLHDTFKIDRYDNIYNGHTSIYLKDVGKISMDWDD